LNTLRKGDIDAWTARLPLAARNARQVLMYLSSMLDDAVADGRIASNPAHRAQRPKVSVPPISPLTPEQIDALREAAPDWFRVAFTLAIGAGLRQSEATGLTVDRVNFLKRELTVDRQLVTPNVGEPTFGPPKSQASYRTIPLPRAVVDELSLHIHTHGLGRDDLILHTPKGAALRATYFGEIWRDLRKRAGLPSARYHDLRHTFASLLLSGGVSVAATASALGHTPAELLRTYAHLMTSDVEHMRSVIAAAFTGTDDVPSRQPVPIRSLGVTSGE
jgi:integrase